MPLALTMKKFKNFLDSHNHAAFAASVAALAVFIVGGILLATKAATSTVAVETEAGTRTSQVVTVNDGSASGGSAIKFTTPLPPPTGDWVRPTASTTGPTGTLASWGGSTTITANDQTISGVDFGGYVKLTGSNITLENCSFNGLAFYGPGPLTIKNCVSNGSLAVDAYYRAVNGVTFDHVHVICGAHDGIDLFSSSTNRVSNVTILDSLVDGQTFPSTSTAHGDGLQVRGISTLTVQRTVLDMYTVGGVQTQKNAALYFENVNGGNNNMKFTNVDLVGGDPYNHTFYTAAVTNSSATNLAIKRGGYTTTANPSGWVFTNVTGPSGSQITP